MDQGMHVSGEHLRFMDQHLMGSRYSSSLPTKKAIFPLEEEWVDVKLQPRPLMEMGFKGY